MLAILVKIHNRDLKTVECLFSFSFRKFRIGRKEPGWLLRISSLLFPLLNNLTEVSFQICK